MEVVIMIAQLLLGLSILVGIHEAGHMVAAKAFGMRVEKFSIGFPPKVWGIQIGETEYSIGALPLGGFVKITGMIDESMDTEQLKSEPQEYEFRSKPAWQRLIVMLGGIIVNVITGVIVFILITFIFGKHFIPKDEVNKNGIAVGETAKAIGLKRGDKLVEVNGKDYKSFNDAKDMSALLEDGSSYTVLRNGERIVIPLPEDLLDRLTDADEEFISFLNPFEVGEVRKKSPADSAGLKIGDKILKVDNSSIEFFQDMKPALENKEGKHVKLTIAREGKIMELNSRINAEGQLGFIAQSLLKEEHKEFGFGESISVGTYDAFNVIFTQIKAFGKIFTGKLNASKSLSGPIGMASIYGSEWNWKRFWVITGMLSMILAFMNLLPIPALDGGHVIFILYEMISGRPPSDNFLKYAQTVGMILLLGLMAFAFGNDIYKLVIKHF